MWLRLLLAGLALLVASLVVAFTDQSRRVVDAHRRAQVAAERLDASLLAVASVQHRARAGVPAKLLAVDRRLAIVRGHEAAETLRALRPEDRRAWRAIAAVERHAKLTGRRTVLAARGRTAAATLLDKGPLATAYATAETRVERLIVRLEAAADAAYQRGAWVVRGGLGAGLLLLLALGATYLGATRRAERTRSERLRAAIAERMSDVITLVAADGTVRWQSSSARRLFRRAPLADGADVVGLFDAEGAGQARETIARVLAQPGGEAAFTATVTGPDGQARAFETLAENRLHDREIRALVLLSRDVTDRVALEEELRRRAFHDALTGLPNRALFEDRMRRALAATGRGGAIAVLFVDLDDFKTVNDSLGHAAGDELLRLVAGRIDEILRPGDTVARLGGDEFAVLLEQVGGPEEAEAVALRLLEALRAPATLAGRRLEVRASVGIATSQAGTAPGDLLRDADAAMYEAKARRDGGWSRFDPALHAQALSRLELSAELPAAIERGELELHYQPIVGLAGEPAGGVEALVRWRHPARGLLGPGEFIELAERTGAIVPLGRWVLEQACRDVGRWQRESGAESLYVSVNVSQAQLDDDAFVTHVRGALAAAGVQGSALMVEVTESVFARDADGAAQRLRELRALGVRTAIDDFGTGHSALSALRRLPVDVLKIDRSFIEEIASRPASRTLLAGIVQLGRSLGLEIIAEGVERPDQARELAALGAMSAQGFLYARPMPAADGQLAPYIGVAAADGA
jgi:diguanylate cyclase (GGDEF)-like protein